jgi:hypothetical protein
MFGWFRPRCPVNVCEKAWVERRTAWLVKTFGWERLRDAVVVLPTPEFFPEPYDQTEADVRILLDRVGGYMGIAPGRVDLELFEEGQDGIHGAAGLYVAGARETIRIHTGLLPDPLALVATLAHELAHALLLGDQRISPEEHDHEWVTDLTTVFLGLGIFGSNSVIRESYARTAHFYAWNIHRQGYLSEDVYGYALALFAWARGETDPSWDRHLRPNVRGSFRAGLHYLAKTGDSLFQPGPPEADAPLEPEQRLAGLMANLDSPSGSARVAALWDLRDPGLDLPRAEPALIRVLKDADPFIRAEAAETLAALGPAARPSVAALVDSALRDDHTVVRTHAVTALRQVGREAETVVPALMSLLGEQDVELRVEAMRALRAFAPDAAAAVPALAEALDEREEIAEEALRTLAAMGPAAAAAIPALRRVLKGEQRGLHADARRALRNIRGQPPRG